MIRALTLSILLILIVISCRVDKKETVTSERDALRPRYHFTPPKNWNNDPNGLVYYDGEYHLYYQYNPYGDKWGHMSWGHAVSKDLTTWEHLHVAIEEYKDAAGDSVMIFSGSVVVTGDTLVAIFTGHKPGRQNQNIAFSTDKGRTFKLYDKNPVIDLNLQDFRDPKVFWYEQQKKWVMTVVIPDQRKAQFYESKNLRDWKLLSEFGNAGDVSKIWECPDLFQITNDKWVLLISGSHPQGGPFPGMQYFIGTFDGMKFVADKPEQYPLYVDYGKDFYAGVTYNNDPEGRKILVAWSASPAYAGDTPTSPWRGGMALPRELSLTSDFKLKQRPVTNMKPRQIQLALNDTIHVSGAIVGFRSDSVYLDRRNAGNTSFNKNFPSIEKAPARLVNGKVKLDIYVDLPLIEIFINDGEAVITDAVYPVSGVK
jgi:fructan beta-fructosidase